MTDPEEAVSAWTSKICAESPIPKGEPGRGHSRQLRVVQYVPWLRRVDGGTYRAQVDMCTLLADAGQDVTLLTCDDRDAPAAWQNGTSGRPKVERLPGPFLPGNLIGPRSLLAATRVIRNADLIHFHTSFRLSNLQIGAIARRIGVPYVVTTHGALDDWCMAQKRLKKTVYHRLFARPFLDGAAQLHCTAHAELDQVDKWYRGSHATVVPLPFDLDPFRELPGPELARRELAIEDDPLPVVLFLSRIHYKKGLERLIDAISALNERGSPCRLLVAGSGERAYVRTLEARVRERGISDLVRFVGMVTGKTKTSLYQLASLFALPTSQENFGLVLTESLACGTPLVTTQGTDIWRELESSGGAVIVNADAREFENAIGGLLADPDRLCEMGTRGRKWVLNEFGGTKIVEQLLDLYDVALEEHRRRWGS